MNPDDLLASIRALARIPSAQQPGDWAALATRFNQLDDWLSMGGSVPASWQTDSWKPYAGDRCQREHTT